MIPEVGVLTTVEPVVVFRFVDGDHEYETPPDATKEDDEPRHTVAGVAVAVILAVLTTTFTVDDFVQPFASVTITMYAPFARDVTLEIDGVALDEEKVFGPLQT